MSAVKKVRLRPNSKIWLKRAESFRMFLEEGSERAHIVPPQNQFAQSLIGQTCAEAYYRNLREKRYYLWLKSADAYFAMQSMGSQTHAFNRSGPIKLMMCLDYKKLYDVLLFEFHQYLTRACFCRLAQHYKVKKLNPRALEVEHQSASQQIRVLLKENRGIAMEDDFKALFVYAYRSALIELALHHKVKVDIYDTPLFTLRALLRKKPERHL